MNTRLLRRIAKVIQEKPKEFNMSAFHFDRKAPLWEGSALKGRAFLALCEIPKERQVSCGTYHCIAGWAQVLSPNRNCNMPAAEDAQRLLGLDDGQAERLFYGNEWPTGFRGWSANGKQAAARIEHFIKTGGAE